MAEPIAFRTKADLVYEHLRGRILVGELRPGDPVPIGMLTRELGVAETPAHEGIRRLEADGLLSFSPRNGAVVTRSGHRDVEEMLALRTELEALALRLAARTMTRAQFAELRGIIDAMTRAEHRGMVEEYARLNRRFHMCTYAAQPYPGLRSLIETLWDASDWCSRMFGSDMESMRTSLGEHESIYAALRRRDGDAAAVFLRAQKHRAAAWLLKRIDGAVAGFEDIRVRQAPVTHRGSLSELASSATRAEVPARRFRRRPA